MKKVGKKYVFGLCIASIFVSMICLFGCSGKKKPEIEVALWNLDINNGLYMEYLAQVESLVPDVKINWVKGQRDIGYYIELAETDSLPDIISVRKFSMKDSMDLNPYLLELTKTEVASAYYDIYLENYRTKDGEIFWIPMSGTVDGIVANKKLFDEYDIPIPQDFDGFISACQSFEEHGIRGYSLDFNADYNTLHILQGMGIDSLSSVDGIAWRKKYENGEMDQLDSKVWLPAFEKIETLNKSGILNEETIYLEDISTYKDFANGKQAMVNISSESFSNIFPELELEVLPYFGEKQNFLLTYPVFNIAISKKVEESNDKKEAAARVLAAMTSQQAQEVLNRYTDGLVSYQRDISFEYTGSMQIVKPYLESNHTYIRLAAKEFFEISQKTLIEMLENHLSAQSALDLMNVYLHQSQ